MTRRSIAIAAMLFAGITGSLAGCAPSVDNETMSVIDGNEILTADLGSYVSAKGVVLAAVLLVAGDVDKGLAQGVVTPAEVDEARIAIDSGTLDMWRQRSEMDEVTP